MWLASWSIVLKRVPEAIISFLPITGIIMLIIMVTSNAFWWKSYLPLDGDGVMDPNSENYDKIIAHWKEVF